MSNSHPQALFHVASFALQQPWALTQEYLSLIVRPLAWHLTHSEAFAPPSFVAGPTHLAPTRQARLALLPIHGPMLPRATMMSDISGAVSYEDIAKQVRALANDPEVSAIVLDVNSPGGSAQGMPELAQLLLDTRAQKPIYAQAHHNMCSAAYWLGCCCTEIIATPSAEVGSVGAYLIHEDLTAALAQAGVKLSVLTAGQYKAEGHPAQPLSDETRTHLQARLDAREACFVGDVARGRGVPVAVVRDTYGKGRTVDADAALALGMVDRIDTLDATLARLGAAPGAVASISARASADALPGSATSHEPSAATGHERARLQRESMRALLMLGLTPRHLSGVRP